jgi:2'-5' RNA ligase
MDATQTALIVAVPEAEAAVGRWRALLDPAASWGVPAHVTVLYPFVAPDQVTEAVLEQLAGVAAAFPRFRVTFGRVAWFGDDVVWLAPAPDEPFKALTMALWRRFPHSPPYGGEHSEVVPHLTIGHGAAKPVLQQAAEAVEAHLPVDAAIGRLRLIAGSQEPGSWRTVAAFDLGES